jgi:elongation factor G
MAFKSAAAHGLKAALELANPILLEPVSELVVTVPEASQGDIMGDLNAKRGRIHGTSAVGRGEVEILAMVPTSEILRYTIDLRSMTGGRGRFVATHSHYDPLPDHLVGAIRR